MAAGRHGPGRIEFPSELDVLISREFDAPIALVFDVLTKPEHVRKWGATPPDAEAVETWQLHETDGVTTITMRLAFRDKASRDNYPARGQAHELTSSDGPGASFDAMEEILKSLSAG